MSRHLKLLCAGLAAVGIALFLIRWLALGFPLSRQGRSAEAEYWVDVRTGDSWSSLSSAGEPLDIGGHLVWYRGVEPPLRVVGGEML